MGARFRAEPAELAATAPSFTVASDDLSSALRTLSSALAGLGDICGGDKQGRAFAAGYLPHLHTVTAAMSKIAAGLATVDDGLRSMAGNYEASDQTAATDFRRIGGGR